MNKESITLYLIGTNGKQKNPLNPVQERLTPQDCAFGATRKKKVLFGVERASPVGINTSLALTRIDSDSEPNLTCTDLKNALKNALDAQQHAKEAIARIKANRIAKQAVIDELKDKEDFREIDNRERKIIRINQEKLCSSEPEYSDSRKLYYNAGKDNK